MKATATRRDALTRFARRSAISAETLCVKKFRVLRKISTGHREALTSRCAL